jgi:SAM-dependent methyltransferase
MMGWIVALLCLVIHSQYLAEGFLISQVAKAAMHKKAPHDIDYETLRNVSVRAEGERYAEEDSSARRALIRKLASLPLVAGYIAPHLSTAETDCDIIQKCSNGAIVEEEAIPGAYQQFCMSLPERSVRLQATGEEINIQQNSSSSVAGRTGVVIWNSSLLLLRILDGIAMATATQDGNFFTDKSVLELGCGTGLCSVAVAKLAQGANNPKEREPARFKVTATDGNEEVVALAEKNAKHNGLISMDKSLSFQVAQMQWNFLDAMQYSEEMHLVIGSDLTYNSNAWPALAQTVSTVLNPRMGIFIYLTCGHAGFNLDSELSGFASVAQSEGLEILTETDVRWPFRNPDSPQTISLTKILQQFFETSKEGSAGDTQRGARVLVFARR